MSLSDTAATALFDSPPTQADRSGSGNSPFDLDDLGALKGGQVDAGSSNDRTFERLLEQLEQLTEQLEQIMGGGSQASSGADSGAGDTGSATADPFAGNDDPPEASASPAFAGSGTSGANTALAGLSPEVAKEMLSMRSGGSDASASPSGAGTAPDGPSSAESPSDAQTSTPGRGQGPQPAPAPAPPPPSSSGSGDAPGSDGGSTDDVDGAKAGGDNISLTVDNNSSQTENFALTNKNNDKFAEADLKPGQSKTIVAPRSDTNLQSMRGQILNADGSIRNDPKLFEGNEGEDGKFSADVSNNNFAGDYGTTGQADAAKMTVSDNEGLTVGDGTANGSYTYSDQDREKGPNPMEMAEDASDHYTIGLGS